jgi:hypothetical protein
MKMEEMNVNVQTQEAVTSSDNQHKLEQETGGLIGDTAAPVEAVESSGLADLLPEDMRQNATLNSFKDVESLAKSYLHAQNMISKRMEDLGPEELSEVYTKLGRPEQPDGYELDLGAAQIDGMEAQADEFKQMAYDLGLSADAAKQLSSWYAGKQVAAVQAHQQALSQFHDQSEELLRQEYGSAFDQRLEGARELLNRYDPSGEIKSMLQESGFGSHPTVVRMLVNLSKDLSEASAVHGTDPKAFGITPNDAQRMIRDKKKDPTFMDAYLQQTHPGHRDAVQEMEELYAVAFPQAD